MSVFCSSSFTGACCGCCGPGFGDGVGGGRGEGGAEGAIPLVCPCLNPWALCLCLLVSVMRVAKPPSACSPPPARSHAKGKIPGSAWCGDVWVRTLEAVGRGRGRDSPPSPPSPFPLRPLPSFALFLVLRFWFCWGQRRSPDLDDTLVFPGFASFSFFCWRGGRRGNCVFAAGAATVLPACLLFRPRRS